MSVPIIDTREEIFREVALRTSAVMFSSFRASSPAATSSSAPAARKTTSMLAVLPTEIKEMVLKKGAGSIDILTKLRDLGAVSYKTGLYPHMLAEQVRKDTREVKKILDILVRRGIVHASKDKTGRNRYWIDLNKKEVFRALDQLGG